MFYRRHLPADSTARIKEVLVAKIREERAEQNGPSPWDLLLEETCTWRTEARLDRHLFLALRQHFGGNISREILLAAAGVKVSRTCLSETKIETLRALADSYGFAISVSSERFIHRIDIGKGGSSNAIERLARTGEDAGLRNVYVAPSEDLAEAAQMLEEAGVDEIFGNLLGIPRCCRDAFIQRSSQAAACQNDFVLSTLDNTSGAMPYDFWLNYPANYFGPGLLSFFPCSFRCRHASELAQNTFQMLAHCDVNWANDVLERHRTNILFTEYQGVHRFAAPIFNNCVHYESDQYVCTESTDVSAIIRSGNRIRVNGKHVIDIYRDCERIHTLEGGDVGMCSFL